MNTGGSGFPVADTYHPNGQVQFGTNGMTLLDWMAGQALVGMCASPSLLSALIDESETDDTPKPIAIKAYEMADAMLAEKARREAVVQESSTTDHFRDATKMIQDRSLDAGNMAKLEALNRELLERIKRLEDAGNEVVYWFSPMAKHQLTRLHLEALNRWYAAKEAKP